jgi:hypothetical protein
VIKHNFDQTPILLETFDQVIRSSEIRSSDPLSIFSDKNMTPKSNKFFCTTLFCDQNCEIFENILNLCSHYFYLNKILSERKNL